VLTVNIIVIATIVILTFIPFTPPCQKHSSLLRDPSDSHFDARTWNGGSKYANA
jgi:hypothetical protein